MSKQIKLKLKSRSELQVFGNMIIFAYTLQANKIDIPDDENKLYTVGMAWQLVSVFEKVAIRHKYFAHAQKHTITLNPGQVCAILNFKTFYKPADPFAEVVSAEILALLDKFFHSL